MKQRHKNSKIVIVKRRIPYYENAQNQAEAQGYFNMASRTIGAYFQLSSKIMGKGLEYEEIRLLFPEIIGIEADDREFRKEVESWYANIIHNVPPEGLSLQIGMSKDNSKPLMEFNNKEKLWVHYQMPLNTLDYIKYHHIKNHPQVAQTLKIANGMPSGMCGFYIEDMEIEKIAKLRTVQLKDEASVIYTKYKNDIGFIRQTLVLLGIDAHRLDKTDLQLEFRKRIEDEDIRKVEQFIEMTKEDLAPEMYKVRTYLHQGILRYEGSKILDESNHYYGDSIREVALEIHKPENKEKLALLEARKVLED